MNYYKTGCTVGAIASNNPLARAHREMYRSIKAGMVFDHLDRTGTPPPMDPREGLYCYGEAPNGEPVAFWLRDQAAAGGWLSRGAQNLAFAIVLDCRSGFPPNPWTRHGTQVGAETTTPATPKEGGKVSRRAAIGMTLGALGVLGVLYAEGRSARGKVKFR